MSDNSSATDTNASLSEDRELVNKLALEVMEPALQAAMREANGKGSPIERMSALGNAYGALLMELLGKKAAESLLRGLADHIAAREDNPVKADNN